MANSYFARFFRNGLLALLVVIGSTSAGAAPIRMPAEFQPTESWAALAAAVEPATVSIQAMTITTATKRDGDSAPVDPFEFFFGPSEPGADTDKPGEPDRSDAGGSGFLISGDGLVVTNFHVIDGATRVTVQLGSRNYPAQIRGVDQTTDLALLKIDAGQDLPYLELADSDAVRVGDLIMVVGNPLNLDKTVTTGVVSAKDRAPGITDVSFEEFIQTDAAINFGNSGGPLVDIHGRVVGIATAINYGAENIGFAVPANTLKNILPALREKGKVTRGYIGVNINNLDSIQAPAFGLTEPGGALVLSVTEEGPAHAAGIEHGDVIVTVDERKIQITRDLIKYVADRGPGATVQLGILRNGKMIQKRVTLGERPAPGNAKEPAPPKLIEQDEWPGIQFEDLTGDLREKLALPEETTGVIVSAVAPTSPLYEQAVRRGNIILEINGASVESAQKLKEILKTAKSGSYLRLYIFAFRENGQERPFFAVLQAP